MEKYVAKAQKLLELERQEEIRLAESHRQLKTVQELEAKGVCLTKLRASGIHTGLYGRCMLSVTPMQEGKLLPSTSFRNRDLVQLCKVTNRGVRLLDSTSDGLGGGGNGSSGGRGGSLKSRGSSNGNDAASSSSDENRGIIYRRSQTELVVAFDGEAHGMLQDLVGRSVSLVKLSNDVTYGRLTKALKDLSRVSSSASSDREISELTRRIVDIRFVPGKLPVFSQDLPPPPRRQHSAAGGRSPQEAKAPKIQFVNTGLNDQQKQAVNLSLRAESLLLIHGPPGTGKTTTVPETKRLIFLGFSYLFLFDNSVFCAVCLGWLSRTVDNLCERLGRHIKVVRVGHPARMLPSIVRHSLDSVVRDSDSASVARALREDLDKTFKRIARLNSQNLSKRRATTSEEKAAARNEKRELWLEAKALRSIDGADVVLSTNAGAAGRELRNKRFDLIVVDEAAQSLEPSTWIPMLKGGNVILAGDHKQLPPVVSSDEALKRGLGHTLFEKLMGKFEVVAGGYIKISPFSFDCGTRIEELYDGRLVAAESVKSRLLADLPQVRSTEETREAMVLIDTAGCGFEEDSTEEGESRSNRDEAELVKRYATKLLDAGLRSHEIGIITPYNAQVTLLREMLGESLRDLEVGTVDGFQGREKECIVLSMVRSNVDRKVGFLSENRRTNVAITRAKRHVAIIADSTTVSSDPFLSRLLSYCEEHADYRNATHELEEEEEKEEEEEEKGLNKEEEEEEEDSVGNVKNKDEVTKGATGVNFEETAPTAAAAVREETRGQKALKDCKDNLQSDIQIDAAVKEREKGVGGEGEGGERSTHKTVLASETAVTTSGASSSNQSSLIPGNESSKNEGASLSTDSASSSPKRTVRLKTLQGETCNLQVESTETAGSVKERAMKHFKVKPGAKVRILRRGKEIKDSEVIPETPGSKSFLVLYIPRSHLPPSDDGGLGKGRGGDSGRGGCRSVKQDAARRTEEKKGDQQPAEEEWSEQKIEKTLLDFVQKSRHSVARGQQTASTSRNRGKKKKKKRGKNRSGGGSSGSSNNTSQFPPRMELPCYLCAGDRKRVHDAIERLRLPVLHRSEGVPPRRRLVIIYARPDATAQPDVVEKAGVSGRQIAAGDAATSSRGTFNDRSKAFGLNQQPSISNPTTRSKAKDAIDSKKRGQRENIRSSSSSGGGGGGGGKSSAAVGEDDEDKDGAMAFDNLLSQAKSELRIGRCGTPQCRAKMNAFTSFICRHCKRRYCSQHLNPALHGCAKEAQKASLQSMKERRQPKMTDARRDRLRAKLKKYCFCGSYGVYAVRFAESLACCFQIQKLCSESYCFKRNNEFFICTWYHSKTIEKKSSSRQSQKTAASSSISSTSSSSSSRRRGGGRRGARGRGRGRGGRRYLQGEAIEAIAALTVAQTQQGGSSIDALDSMRQGL
eukprot:jgi/Bigna1/79464/fgenesh1_pg.62_\